MGEAFEVLDTFAECLFRLLSDRHRFHVAEMEMTVTQAQALRLLREAPMPTGGLASRLGITAPAVTQLTDRLLRKRLIERRVSNTDRRSVMIALTEKGNRMEDGFRRRRGEAFGEVLSAIPSEEQVKIVDSLRKLNAVLEGLQSDSPHDQKPPTAPGRGSRTAVGEPKASNEAVSEPRKVPARRMRIEWD